MGTYENRQIYFHRSLTVTLMDFIADGMYRAVYDCDHMHNGREYMVKVADATYEHRARLCNMAEHALYKASKDNPESWWHDKLPEFKAISPCGKFLLVEKCETACAYYDDDHPIFHGEWNEECEHCLMYNDEGDLLEEREEDCDYCGGQGTLEPDRDYILDQERESLLGSWDDDHDENWGFTLDEGKPVIMDIGTDRFDEDLRQAGVPALKVLTMKNRTVGLYADELETYNELKASNKKRAA